MGGNAQLFYYDALLTVLQWVEKICTALCELNYLCVFTQTKIKIPYFITQQLILITS